MQYLSPVAAILVAALAASSAAQGADPAPVSSSFLDARTLRVKGTEERNGDDVLAWGRARLTEIDVAGRPPVERAARIVRYIHERFAFSPERPPTLADFIANRSGNCYAHARMSAFMLRLAGVPARFMYEIHLERKNEEATAEARAGGTGLFGEFHNDHFWVLYHDGRTWIPLDSALGISNRDEFLRVKIDEPAGGVANPPFLLWRDSDNPEAAMENVTAAFWIEIGRATVPGVAVADWKALLDTFGGLDVLDLRQPLSVERQAAIAGVGRQFFAARPKP